MAQSRTSDSPFDPYDQKIMALSRVLKALRGTTTAEEAISLALAHVHQEFEFEVAWVGLYDRVNHRLVTKGCHSPSPLRAIRTMINLTPGDVMEQVVVQQRPLIVADLQNEIRAGEWGSIAKQMALQSAIIFPIKHQDVCFGLLVLASPAWGKSASLGERSYLAIVMGELAAALHLAEAEQQRQQTKRLEQPLLALIGRLGNLPDIDSQLKDTLSEIQRFIGPQRSRVFWFEPKGNYFWQRVPGLALRHAQPTQDNDPSLHIAVDEVRGLYQALCNQQLVVVGESRGALKTIVSDRLMQQIRAQSLMVAPISSQGDLVGFISVEGSTPRIWKEAEKQFLIGAAQLLSLTMPAAAAREGERQSQLDEHLTTGVIQGIHGDVDWHRTLQTCFSVLQDRLAIQQFFVLLFNPDRNGYELCFQSQAAGLQRGVPMLWPCLDDVDWQMLERSPSAISIDNLEHDLKLMAWRPHLLDLGAQAVLVGNVAPGNAPEGIVLICDRISRQWVSTEQSLFEAVARQIGVILHQWQLQRQLDQQQNIYESIQWGLQALHKGLHPDQLELVTLQHVMQLLQGSAVLLVTWPAGSATAAVTQLVCQDSSVGVKTDHAIPVGTDAVINWALQTDGMLPLTIDELPDESAWLTAPAGRRLLITALRTAPSHAVTGVVVVVSPYRRPWASHHLTIFKLLTSQLAWSRRHLALSTMLTQQRQDLENLNWYKHHRLEDLYRTLGQLCQELGQLQDRDSAVSNDLQRLHSQIATLMESSEAVLVGERWELHSQYQTMPLISLLNRLVERVNPILEARQLWSKVHNESNVVLGGDMLKLELILYEVMAAACNRSRVGGRIDLWCRVLNLDWVELSITDDGHCSDQLLEELNHGHPADALAPSALDGPPGLHLAICKILMEQLGGEMTFLTLDDGRTHSRLLLPLAAYSDQPKTALGAVTPTEAPSPT
ncbi:MAG TPA: ATP-binding protein [Nodosilinea sp.]|nr:ATP-binding protein [Nodosilinea sp.]